MAINDIMEIGRQGLVAQRQALQTTSNNIANANTPGYSRQRAEMHARAQESQGGVRTGGGVEVKDVIRVHDSFLQNQIYEESRSFGAAKSRADGMHQVESILSTDGHGIGETVNKFFNDARELSVNPEQPALRATVLQSAKQTADGFRKLSDSMYAMKKDIDSRVESSVQEVNSMTKQVADLNGQIAHAEALQTSPNDLYDRRDGLLRDLSMKLGLQTNSTEQGHINASLEGLAVLVNGNQANELVVLPTPAQGGKAEGSLDIFVKDGPSLHAITNKLQDGELGGLLHVRDEVLNRAIDHLDQVAYQFTKNVNEIHRDGAGADGVSGRNLFTDFENSKGAASRLGLSEEMQKAGADGLAAGLSVGAQGDNRVALQIANLQSQHLLPGNIERAGEAPPTSTLNESLNTLVGTIGAKTAEEDELLQHHESVMNQLDNYRQSVSGVSLEEEAVNMMQFQTVFNASAKAMKVGDELLQTILGIKE